MKWKLMLLAVMVLMVAPLALAGCATTATPQEVQARYVQACGAYGIALSGAAQLRAAGKLSPAQIQAVNDADGQITPICTGALPANPTAATLQVTQAAAALAALAVVQAQK